MLSASEVTEQLDDIAAKIAEVKENVSTFDTYEFDVSPQLSSIRDLLSEIDDAITTAE